MSSTASATEPIIACEHVCVAYGREEVLHDVCLTVDRGMFLPFVGPNGAGKTTLLRAILGLLRPRRGRIVTPFHRFPAGYVPQQKSIDPLYPVSVREIVGMGLYPQLGWWRPRREGHRKTVESALEEFHLAEHALKTFAELSGGMKQKALLARAFVSGAEVFVMDEPTSELDEQSEKDVMAHLYRLCQEQGKTVLFAHHGLDTIPEQAPVLCSVNHGGVHLAERRQLEQSRNSGQGAEEM